MNNVKLLLSCERTRRNATLCLSVEMSGGKMWLQQRVVKSSGWVWGCGCRGRGGGGGWGGVSAFRCLYTCTCPWMCSNPRRSITRPVRSADKPTSVPPSSATTLMMWCFIFKLGSGGLVGGVNVLQKKQRRHFLKCRY